MKWRGLERRLGPDVAGGGDNRLMTRHWSPLAIAYAVLAVCGLVGTWIYNGIAISQMNNFITDLATSGPAVSSITTDLLVVAIAGSIFILFEARRLGMKRGWLYVVLSGVTAFAFTFPLFLAMRQRRLNQAAGAAGAAHDAEVPIPGRP